MRTDDDGGPSNPPQLLRTWALQLRDLRDPVRRGVRSRFEIDTRALAALRISLGLIILIDLLHRWRDLGFFYTDDGVYPRAVYEATNANSGYSIHAFSGELWFQQFLFVVAAIFAIALLLGYRTRLVGFISLVLLLSLHARNPMVLNGGDRLLRVLLLLALLTPLSERWSIDALRRGSARTTVVGFGTAALLVQPIAVFSSNAILKREGETWYAGDGLQIALANDEMTIFLGNSLVEYPILLEVANWLWVILLVGSAVFLLLTTGRLRAFFVFVYLGAFAGLLLTVAVGLFPLVLAASVIPFLTKPFWDGLARLAPTRGTRRLLSASQLGPLGRPPMEQRWLAGLRDNGHESVASYVTAYGRSFVTVAGVIALVWIVLFSGSHAVGVDVPDEIESNFPDEQRWGLYAPDPSESYSWYVAEAELENGSTVDAFEGGEVVTDRPPDASQEYDTFRERKFMESVRDSGREGTDDSIAERYTDWVCEQAQADWGGDVAQVTISRLVQPSPLDGEYEDPLQLTVLERECALSNDVTE
ncbi:HTTM domain-containing protein [Halobacteria archaeon AArc-dxtr1]|nr:HTTM domain-containing protein [Halobacteria archaeon AArc-dxtr1]